MAYLCKCFQSKSGFDGYIIRTIKHKECGNKVFNFNYNSAQLQVQYNLYFWFSAYKINLPLLI